MASTTTTATVVAAEPSEDQAGPSTRTLNVSESITLRLVPRRKKKSVRWTEETVDNEFLGKKSSKKCCIFHRKKAFGEWSDDEDSDFECDNCDEASKNNNQQKQEQPAPEAQQQQS